MVRVRVRSFSCATTRLMARLVPIAGGGLAFAMVSALAAPALLAANREPAAAVASAPDTPATLPGDRSLENQLNGTTGLTIAGDRLNVRLLRRFYARHGFAPVWTDRPAQASSLLNAVMHAGDQGLAPELFHANLLRSPGVLPPLDRELLLSDAFLSYADALARGAVPVERREDDETLTPAPIDVAAALDAAIASPDPGAAIEALAPTTPTYRLLRQALQNLRADTPAGGKAPSARIREIEINLERQRWLPRPLPADRVWVNAADERAVLYLDGRPVFSTKVIVGRDEQDLQSPEFRATITGLFFNPPWIIPEDIAAKEILPKASRDPNYLAKHHIEVLPDGTLQQPLGLGHLMLEMQNRFGVYLHDTDLKKSVFSRDDRRISHGCIRLEHPRELAALLMHEPIEAIDQGIETGRTYYKDLPQPVPVFIVYETAFADADGKLEFRPDIYGRDAEIWQYLHPTNRAVAEREAPSRRRNRLSRLEPPG